MRSIRAAVVLTFVLASALALALVRASPFGEPPPPVHAALPAFSLVDQEGRPFDRESLRGSAWVVDTVYTRCTSICPRLSRRMRALQDRIGSERVVTGRDPGVRLLSIGVDPAFDTRERLAAWGAKVGADPGLWRVVTGDPAEIDRLVRDGLRLGLDRAGAEPIHADRFVLVDEEGGVRGWYDDDDAGMLALERALAAMRRGLR